MPFEWLRMRILEERERQQRETQTVERLPLARAEVGSALGACIQEYTRAAGPEAAELQATDQGFRLVVREPHNGQWEPRTTIEVSMTPELPGFHVDRPCGSLDVVVGMLPGDRLFYRDGDQYLTMEELTRRILDRVLFPELGG
jgi:hypothetical protein